MRRATRTSAGKQPRRRRQRRPVRLLLRMPTAEEERQWRLRPGAELTLKSKVEALAVHKTNAFGRELRARLELTLEA